MQFLSEEWVTAVAQALAESEAVREATKRTHARVQQVVNRGDERLSYWIEIDDGEVRMGTGSIDSPSVTVTSDYDTAAALAKGELSPMAAFFSGKIEISNMMTAMGLQGPLAEFGRVVKSVPADF
jgi:putative sterol carrier protein